MDQHEISLKDMLKGKGYKNTPQREIILDVMEQQVGKHLSIEEIYDIVKKTNSDIGLATVYRTLLLFDNIGLVQKIDLDDGFSRYELNRHNNDHKHHHLICTQCGSISEVEQDFLEALEQQIMNEHGFFVKDHRVKFYGICNNCGNSKE
jgi:Fur family transcriptional regulator, ferric uptake regulator